MPRRSLFFLISISALLALGFTTARASRHHHNVSISGHHRQPAMDCSDIHIRFDDEDAVVRSEERTLTKSEAAVLRVQPHSNGGVQVTARTGTMRPWPLTVSAMLISRWQMLSR